MSKDRTSRVPGFYRLPLAERRHLLERTAGLRPSALADLADGGLDVATADRMIENVVGTYALPFGVAMNFVVNGREVFVPMVVEVDDQHAAVAVAGA